MPLAQVLSAMREIILDDEGVVSESFEDRLKLFQKRFPRLTSEEQEDLAKIPHDRFRIYTRTIFNGEASVLSKHFPISLALVESVWGELYGSDLNRFELVKLAHKKQPWVTQTTQGLGHSLELFLTEDRKEIAKRIPALKDVFLLEQYTLNIKRDPHDEINPRAGKQLEELLALSVGELLECNFNKAGYVVFENFQHDVLALHRYFYRHDETLPSWDIEKKQTPAIGSRNANLLPRWYQLELEVFDYLRELKITRPYNLGELAEIHVASCEHQIEAEQFKSFLELLSSLVSIGAVVVC